MIKASHRHFVALIMTIGPAAAADLISSSTGACRKSSNPACPRTRPNRASNSRAFLYLSFCPAELSSCCRKHRNSPARLVPCHLGSDISDRISATASTITPRPSSSILMASCVGSVARRAIAAVLEAKSDLRNDSCCLLSETLNDQGVSIGTRDIVCAA